jgi:hypothetical protein
MGLDAELQCKIGVMNEPLAENFREQLYVGSA